MGKKGYNWKARQVVDTVIANGQHWKVQLETQSRKNEHYDDCNTLVIPSKKRRTFKKKTDGPVVTKILSKTQRKKLEKIVEKKKKKENRSSILEALSKVQAPEELLSQLTSITSLQTKGLKRHISEEQKSINSIAGSKKKRLKLIQEEVLAKSSQFNSPNIVGFEPSSGDESIGDNADDDEEFDVKDEPIDSVEVIETNNELAKNDYVNETSCLVNNLSGEQISGVVNNKVIVIKEKIPCLKGETKEIVSKAECIPSVFIPVLRDVKIQEGRLKLPILGEEQAIMEAIRENPIVLLAGETGSGKTTQVPQFLYEAGYASNNKIIGITEPRRVAATAMSKRVAQELNMTEDKVSYLIRFEGNATSDTKIKFMTDGVLLKELQTDFLLSKYSVIILDEAHERSVYTDILIGLLSRIVPLRNKRGIPLKLIIMSATLRLSDFIENTRLFKTPPPVIKVESRQFPVTIHFNKQTPQDYVKEAYRKACKIHTQLPEGGILIFLTGQQEVNLVVKKLRKAFPLKSKNQMKLESVTEEETCEEKVDEDLKDAMKKVKKTKKKYKKSSNLLPIINLDNYELTPQDDTEGDMLDGDSEEGEEWEEEEGAYTTVQPLWVLPLFSLLPGHKQAKVFEPVPEGCRLCVVATNVAETSLTIPNVKYVVDCGKVKTRLYDAHTGVSTFDVLWTSKASANQRAGRAGRTSAGHCYRLYSSAVFNDDFCEWAVPEMQRRPVDELLLQMKALGIDRVVNFPFPSPPDSTQLKKAEQRLTLLGALQPSKKKDDCCSKLTPLGQTMSIFPVAPRFAKMLCLSHQSGLLNYTLAIVAALSVQEFLLSGEKHWLKVRRQWAGTGNSLLLGDVMVLLRAVGAAEYANFNGDLEKFCTAHGLRHKAVVECRKLRLHLTNQINMQLPGLSLVVDPKMTPPTDTQARQLRQIVLAGMVDQVACKLTDGELTSRGLRKGKPVYQTPEMEEVVHMPSSSALYKTAPEWIAYQEIFQTDKMYFRCVTAIEPEWLPMFAPTLCNLSSPLTEPPPRYNAETGVPSCHFSGTFGRRGWQLPVTELEFPEGLDRFKWFAVFFLDGSVCQILKKYTKSLLSTPQTMVKSWAGLQPRTDVLLKTLVAGKVDSKSSLLHKWEEDPKYLLNAYQSWLPESVHSGIMYSLAFGLLVACVAVSAGPAPYPGPQPAPYPQPGPYAKPAPVPVPAPAPAPQPYIGGYGFGGIGPGFGGLGGFYDGYRGYECGVGFPGFYDEVAYDFPYPGFQPGYFL